MGQGTLAESTKMWSPSLDDDGCEFVRGAVLPETLSSISQQIDRLLQMDAAGVLASKGVAYGIRNVLEHWPGVMEIVRVPLLRSFIDKVLGPGAGVVRVLVFDKPPERSWTLPWHRDRTIAVDAVDKGQLPKGFGNLTCKAGTYHVCAAESLLERMLTLRLSVDPMNHENGQLVVLPGSHQNRATSGVDGDLNSVSAAHIQAVTCDAGDVFAMRPLLAHSSINSLEGTKLRRRVLHIELAASLLPEPLQWKHYLSV